METLKDRIMNAYRTPTVTNLPDPKDIGKEGELMKQKNMKKRYFVLRKDTPERLEYYESKKKFDDGAQPRKKYELNKCYAIIKLDSQICSNVFALFVNSECVTLVADSKESMQDWVLKLQELKRNASGSNSNVEHKHIWHVDIQDRSLANSNGLVGPHLLCLDNRSLSLVKSDNEYTSKKEFRLHTIRQCIKVNEFFAIEFGKSSCINSGLLWMKAEDAFIAGNMHDIVSSTMNQKDYPRERTHSVCTPKQPDTDLAPLPRHRADSTPSRSRTSSDSINFTNSPTSPHDHLPHRFPRLLENFGTSLPFSDDNPRHTPDREMNPDDDSEYVNMNQTDNANTESRREAVPDYPFSSQRDYLEEDHNEYIFQNSLVGFPRRCSHSAFSSDLGSPSGCSSCTPHGTSTPVSPLGMGGVTCWKTFPPSNQLPSPQASSASHSRSSSLLDDICSEYISMQPGVPPQVSGPSSGNTNTVGSNHPYLEMGPGPGVDIGRVSSPPTPIPMSPRDDAYHEISINSGNSSLTSGTDSSDIPLNELGTPSSTGSTLGTFAITDHDDPQMRPIRTNSIGSKPEKYNRKNSAPMLVCSPVSHSWSGTPGSHFRNVNQTKTSSRDGNHLLLDYSGNKSVDNISDAKDKKSFWPFSSHRRHFSTSKVGETSGLGSREKKLSEGDSHRAIDIPISSHKDYCKLDYSGNSPRTLLQDSGYLPMHPPFSMSGSSNALRLATHRDHQWDMSSSLSSCGSQDGYVDMTQGSSPGSLVLASSSSSSNSINFSSRHRRTGNVPNPLSSIDLPSPLEEDIVDSPISSSEPDNSKKKGKKSSRRSLRGSSKKKKSDSSLSSKGSEGDLESKNKSPGPLTSLTNLLSRKVSNPKFPLSPQGNMKLNPLAGLGKAKDTKETSSSPPLTLPAEKSQVIQPEKESNCAISSLEANSNIPKVSSHNHPPSILEKINETGKDDRIFETSKRSSIPLSSQSPRENRTSLCEMVGKSLKLDVDTTSVAAQTPSPNAQRTRLAAVEEDRNYVNMKPGSPKIVPLEIKLSPKTGSSLKAKSPSLTLNLQLQPSSDDLISGANDKLSIRSSLEDPSSHYEHKAATDLDIPSTSDQPRPSVTERSRSHSGPGSSVSASYSKMSDRGQGDGRAASASSSPISASPPTSPTLGSVSSMSSLSEGGLSSASSTCTVVNVGMTRVPSQQQSPAPNSSNSTRSTPQPKMGKFFVPPLDGNSEQSSSGTVLDKDTPPPPPPAQSSPNRCTSTIDGSNSSNLNRKSYSGSKSSINYVSLDLGAKDGDSSPRSRRKSSSPTADDISRGYAEIDLNKTEGLRNTSLARDSTRH